MCKSLDGKDTGTIGTGFVYCGYNYPLLNTGKQILND